MTSQAAVVGEGAGMDIAAGAIADTHTNTGAGVKMTSAALMLVGLAGAAAFFSGGMFRDTQAALNVGAVAVLLFVAGTGVAWRWTPAHRGFLGFIGISVVAASVSVWPTDSLLEASLLISYFIIFLLATSLADRVRLRLAVHALVFMGAVIAAIGLYNYSFGAAAELESLRHAGNAMQANQLAGMVNRVFGTFYNASRFAGLLALLMPLGLALAVSERARWIKSAVLLELSLMALAHYLTFSKGGWLALAVALGVVFAMARGRGAATRRKWLLPVGITSGLSLMAYGLYSRYSYEAVATSGAGRLAFWRGAWRLAISRPWLGVGPGAYGTALPRFQEGTAFSRHAHNTYIQIAAEVGWPGLAGFLLLIGLVVFISWRRLVDSPAGHTDWLRLGLFGAMAGFLVHNLFEYTWYVPGVAFAFWVVAGLAVSADRDGEPKVSAPGPARWALVASAAVYLYPLLLVFAGYTYAAQATSLRQANYLERAERAYAKSLRIFPYNAEARDGLAQSLYLKALQRQEKVSPVAIDQSRLAAKMRPTWPFYHMRLGDYLVSAGREKEALQEYKTAVALYPNDPLVKLRLGNFFLRNSDYAKALDIYADITALAGMYGVSPQATGEQTQQATVVRMAYLGSAQANLGLGRFDRAYKSLEAAESLAKEDTSALLVRAQILTGQKRYEEAIEAFSQVKKESIRPSASINYQLATVLLAVGRRQAALSELKGALKIDKNFVPALNLWRRLGGPEPAGGKRRQ